MTVSILTDSAAALPSDLAERHAIGVVPMWLNIDGEARHEDEVPLAELLGRADVKTSGPTPGEFEAAARAHLGDGGELICTVASSMSATYDAAVAVFTECVKKNGGSPAKADDAVKGVERLAAKFNAELRAFKQRNGG